MLKKQSFIIRVQKLALLLLALVVITPISAASATQIQLVTDLGNVFTVKNIGNGSQNNNGPSNSFGAAFGVAVKMNTYDYSGRVIYGSSDAGKGVSLVPYATVPQDTKYAAVIRDTDPVTSLEVPKLQAAYDYSNGALIPRALSPNILGYSDSRVIGTGSVTTTDNGITLHTSDGSSYAVLQVNDNLKGMTVYLRGSTTGSISFAAPDSPSYDLIHTDYNSNGFLLYSTTGLVDSPRGIVACDMRSCWGTGQIAHTVTVTVNAPATTSSIGSYSATAKHKEYVVDTCWGWGRGRHCSFHWVDQYTPLQINTVTKKDQVTITSLQYTYTDTSWLCSICDGHWAFQLYSTYPLKPLSTFTAANFETQYTIPVTPGPLYVIMKGDNSIIKAESYNPTTDSLLKIYGLPANTIYQITKNSITGVEGVTDGSSSGLQLNSQQITIAQQDDPGVTLLLYPSSMYYRGPFSTAVFDLQHLNITHLSTSSDQVYVPFAYIQIPVAVPATITDVKINHDVTLGYLDGNYSPGSSLFVPIIPGEQEVDITVNGQTLSIPLNAIENPVGLKAIPVITNTNAQYSSTGQITSIDVNTVTSAFAIAPNTGRMFATAALRVSGESSLTSDVSMYFVPNPPPPPRPRDPLSVYVDVYVNGQFVKSDLIYYDSDPIFSPLQAMNGLTYLQAENYKFKQTTTIGNEFVNVNAGDMVQFIIRTTVHADGQPITIKPYAVTGGVVKLGSTTSAASATANIYSGTIITGMSY